MEKIKSPIAKREKNTITVHGIELTDPYAWMKERENAEVLEHLKSENAYTSKMTEHTKDFQKSLYKEMLGRIKETDLTVPVKEDNYYYYSRTEEGKSYPRHCRKKGNLKAEEELLLDENKMAKGLEYFSLGDFEVSDNHNFLAYSTDTNGSEKYNVFIKDLKTGKLLKDKLKDTSGDLFWSNDGQYLFYTRLDDTMRPYQLFRHKIGTKEKEDKLIFQEDDVSFFLGADKSRSRKYIFVQLGSMVSSEVWFLPTNDLDGEFQLIAERKKDVEYTVDHNGEYFYILTNEDAKNFKLLKAPVKHPNPKNWQAVMPYNEAIKLEDLDAFKNHLVIYGRKDGYKFIRILDIKRNRTRDVRFPESVYTYWSGDNPDFNTTKLRFAYTSLISPQSIYDYDMVNHELELLKEYEVQGGYDKSKYVMERHYAIADDGTKIPMSVIYKKGLQNDGNNPCWLYAYGSYGACSEPYFSSTRFSLLDRGFVCAIAHIRGGGEMGRQWYEDGKFLKKKNTFTDFINCGEYLVSQKYTNEQKLCIAGGSAGGLLTGAVANMRPELFGVVLSYVPFVDVINTMLDENLPLTVIEYDEWGDPNKQEFFEYMLSYSPYDNIEKKDYPNMLVTGGLNDPRVQYWEPTKYVAKLRASKTDNKKLLLKMNMGAGHGGKSGRYGALEERAFEYAFMLDCLGIKE